MGIREFSTQLNLLESSLKGYALQLTRNSHDSEDLYQETSFRAFKYRHMYTPGSNLRAWLMTIMRNTYINEYRKSRRRQHISDPTDTQFLINSHSVIENNSGESNITVEELNKLIFDLSENLRIPFIMAFEGFKYDEIAEHLDLPLGTVKSRVFFARKKLQEAVREYYKVEDWKEVLTSA